MEIPHFWRTVDNRLHDWDNQTLRRSDDSDMHYQKSENWKTLNIHPAFKEDLQRVQYTASFQGECLRAPTLLVCVFMSAVLSLICYITTHTLSIR